MLFTQISIFVSVFLIPPSLSFTFFLQTSVCTLPQDLGEELFLHLAWGSTELLHNQINIAMIHPLATTASCKFCWWCLAAYEIKKDRERECKKKPLLKNLSTIDFLPCWSCIPTDRLLITLFFLFLLLCLPCSRCNFSVR